MYPHSFRLMRVESMTEAAEAVARYGEDARLLAGGQSLVPLLKLRLVAPGVVIDLGPVPREPVSVGDNGDVLIPALTTHARIYAEPAVVTRFDVVRDAIPEIADVQVRNMGTIGGSVAEADPAGDWGPVLLALDGSVHVRSTAGERSIPAQAFFTGMFATALQEGEVITALQLPPPPDRTGGVYLKVERRAGGYALASVAIQLTMDAAGRCAAIGIGCGAVGDAPLRPVEVEAMFLGETLSDELVNEAAERLRRVAEPVSDNRGSEEYKRNLCGVLFKRGMRLASRRALGEEVAAHVFAPRA